MSTPITPNPAPHSDDPAYAAATDQPVAPEPAATGSPDPITGEPGAHPVGVGVGALSAGAAGAAIGSFGGPIGVLIGAAIGAVAGGLAGKEVAATNEAPVAASTDAGTTLASAEEPPLVLPPDAPTPITMGSVPGEGFRAAAGSGFADDPSLGTRGTSTLPAAPRADLEDDALPMTAATGAGAAAATGLQAPAVLEDEPLAGTPMPANGEEAVRVAAYYHYLDRTRTGQHGDAVSDWLEAEHETTVS